MLVADGVNARETISVLSREVLSSEVQEQNKMVKSSLEREYDVVINFVNERLNMKWDVYSTIIKIANDISKLERLSRKEQLESIANEVSTETNPVTLTNMGNYIALKATIGKDTYALKRLSKVPSGKGNDTLITEFKSPYIIEALITFKNDTDEWIVMEYVGPGIPDYHGDFTKEEIRLVIHDCLMGLDTIHKRGYYHKDLFAPNIVYAKNDKDETVGFKVIDLGISEAGDTSQMTTSELCNEIEGVLQIVEDHLRRRVRARPEDVGFKRAAHEDITIYGGVAYTTFLEEDSILADFFMTASRWVSKPATSISDLLKHQYFTGANADLFGEKEWEVDNMNPVGFVVYDFEDLRKSKKLKVSEATE